MDDLSWQRTADDIWAGRIDGSGSEHARWHQLVTPTAPQDGHTGDLALIGFASDEGVRRNSGRPGAAEAPDALRRALAPLAWHSRQPGSTPLSERTRPVRPHQREGASAGGAELPVIHDAGTLTVVGSDLEGAQRRLGDCTSSLLDRHGLVVVLGGGHETAYGSYLGRRASQRCVGARVGVLNLDAHFDLRDHPVPTSGTPFLQMARDEQAAGRIFDYAVLGISATGNTPALFAEAARWGVRYLRDVDCTPGRTAQVAAMLESWLAGCDLVHLSIDMDVLPASTAPGVSAPAAYGVPMETAAAICGIVAASGKLVLVDVVEVAPRFDPDGRTCRAAARLIADLVAASPGR
ncbi:formiminoglutamase [Austwickia chelonae]|uniref:Formimidoylglutamase n=1 Tax=Austwickia chelonae NBRC 105200 TaxID=1184607 RepID=K6V6U7_9MICO|nr:formimidoylglutamase [Austwickia chelonae]GAB77953.1 formimidoylglutamase [Austwickia chelonae NBRC 105200]SEV92963.1 formiminoglutamase [Austwickia chelonae]